MGVELPAHRTPIDPSTLLEAIGRSYLRLFQQYATREFCLVILSQCYIECGDGAHNCWLYDIGNVTARVGGTYDYCTLHSAWEIVNGQRVTQTEHFRAFATLDEGVDQHLAFLHTNYSNAFLAAMSGDGASFAHELKVHGYYSGFEHEYVAGVTSFMAKYSGLPLSPWEQEMQSQIDAQSTSS